MHSHSGLRHCDRPLRHLASKSCAKRRSRRCTKCINPSPAWIIERTVSFPRFTDSYVCTVWMTAKASKYCHTLSILIYIYNIYISIHSFEQRPSETQPEQTSKKSSQKTIPLPRAMDQASAPRASCVHIITLHPVLSFFMSVFLSFVVLSFFHVLSFLMSFFLSFTTD